MSKLNNIVSFASRKQAKIASLATGVAVAVSATASQAAFDATTVAAETTAFTDNVLVGTGMAVGFALAVGAGMVIIKFIRRGTGS